MQKTWQLLVYRWSLQFCSANARITLEVLNLQILVNREFTLSKLIYLNILFALNSCII